jgi:hypothetical protein
MNTPTDDRPGTEQAPFLHNVGLIEGTQITPAPGKVCRLKEVRINGREFDPTKFKGFFYYSWDYGKRWSRFGSSIGRFPEVLSGFQVSDRGGKFRWAVGFMQPSAGACLTAPVIEEIEADFEVVHGVDLRDSGERYLQTIPRF